MLKIKREDLKWASEEGYISTEQVDPLWSALESRPGVKSKFDLINVINYFGGLLIIFGMGWFMNEAWDSAGGTALFALGVLYVSIFSYIAHYLYNKKKLEIAGGLVAAVAVCLVPLAIFGFQKMTGLWPQGDPGRYKNYHIWVKGSWFFLELGTIVAGLTMLRFIKFTFISAPIFLSLWYMSMDITPLLFGKTEYSWDERKLVSVIFGAIILLISYFWDRRTKLDYAFWGYLFGMLAFWGGLSSMSSNSELDKFIYFCINLFFILISVLFERRIFVICGAFGSIGYLSHLANKVFKDFLSFPIAISIIGLAIIAIGIKYQKNKEAIDKKVIGMLPKFLLDLSPTKRVSQTE
jgi:hypothetical protein